MLFNKEKQGTLKNLAGECYFDLIVIGMIISSIPEPTWGWFAHLHLCGSVSTCIYRTVCCSPWDGMSQIGRSKAIAELQLLVLKQTGGGRFCWAQLWLQQLWPLLFKQDAALSLGTGSLVLFLSIRACSLCCPLLGCLAMRSHMFMIHQPWQLVHFWPRKGLEMTAIRGTAIELWLFQKLCFPVAHLLGSSGHFT